MKLSPQNLAIINNVIQIWQNWEARKYSLADLNIANTIFTEIKKCVKDDKFIEWNIPLTSEQKVFILKFIDEKDWTIGNAESVIETRNILNK